MWLLINLSNLFFTKVKPLSNKEVNHLNYNCLNTSQLALYYYTLDDYLLSNRYFSVKLLT